MKFKLVAGQYVDGPQGQDIVYNPGDIIETDIDLANRFNQPNSTKFERVVDKTPASSGRPMPPVARPDPVGRPFAQAVPPQPHVSQAVSGGATGGATTGAGISSGGGTATATLGADTLDAMSVKDLIAHAQAEEIDLKGAKTKEEILKTIRAAIGRGF